MSHVALLSFRLGGGDGVSIEAAKWQWALGQCGHVVTTVAGSGEADILLPGLAIGADEPPTRGELEASLTGVDLVIVENLTSLPLNIPARDLLYEVLRDRPALFHHHDLPWHRPHLAHLEGPADGPGWAHVTINEISRADLAARGITSTVLRNRFDCDPPLGDREMTRRALGLTAEALVLLPTRAIPRKNVAGAVTLAEQLDATLWLLGPPEDGYEEAFEALIDASRAPTVRGLPPGATIHDAYAASDLVVMPSTWEGFGNPVLESVTHRRPLALNRYPVALELLAFGFDFPHLTDIDALSREMRTPNVDRLDRNERIAREHFTLADLPEELTRLLARQFPDLDL